MLLPFICPSPTKSVAKQKSLASPGDIFDEGNIATDEEFIQYKVSNLQCNVMLSINSLSALLLCNIFA